MGLDQPESPDSSESPNLLQSLDQLKYRIRTVYYVLFQIEFNQKKLLYPGSVVPLAMLLSPAGELGLHCLCFLQFDYLPGWGWVVLCKWKVWDVLVWPGGGGQVRAESFLSECVTLLYWHPDITLSHTPLWWIDKYKYKYKYKYKSTSAYSPKTWCALRLTCCNLTLLTMICQFFISEKSIL